jgi:glutathione S-transferase
VVVLAHGLMDKCVALSFERLFHSDKHINRDFEKRMMQQITAALHKLEHDCGAPWFFDGKMTQADITAGCLIGYMKMRVPDMFPAGKYPKLHHLALHCEATEHFVKARASPDETVPGETRN